MVRLSEELGRNATLLALARLAAGPLNGMPVVAERAAETTHSAA